MCYTQWIEVSNTTSILSWIYQANSQKENHASISDNNHRNKFINFPSHAAAPFLHTNDPSEERISSTIEQNTKQTSHNRRKTSRPFKIYTQPVKKQRPEVNWNSWAEITIFPIFLPFPSYSCWAATPWTRVSICLGIFALALTRDIQSADLLTSQPLSSSSSSSSSSASEC